MTSGEEALRCLTEGEAYDQVLRGTDPADLPVETGECFLNINLKTAQAISLDIPDEILLQADTIIR